jgi:hypothetical protein
MNKTDKEKNEKFVIEHYSKLGIKKCMGLLNLTKGQISYIAQKHMLYLKPEIKTKILSDSKLKKNGEYKVNLDIFKTNINEYSAYLLGLLWADGYISKKDNSINIECVNDDMVYFKNIFDKTGEWSKTERLRKNKTRIITKVSTSNKFLKDFLIDNDYYDKSIKSPNKILSIIPNKLINFFLLGMIDGDGCFYFNQKYGLRQFTLTGSLNQDWDSFEKIFKNLNITYKIIRKPNSNIGYSQIRIINKENIKKLGEYIYPCSLNEIGLPRKFDKYKLIIQ